MRFEHVEDHGGCSYAVNGENLSAGARKRAGFGSIFAPGRCGEDRRDGFGKIDRHADISSVPAGWTSFLFRFQLGSRHLAAGADEAACGFRVPLRRTLGIFIFRFIFPASRARRLIKVVGGGE
jgi:hypothetical protein